MTMADGNIRWMIDGVVHWNWFMGFTYGWSFHWASCDIDVSDPSNRAVAVVRDTPVTCLVCLGAR